MYVDNIYMSNKVVSILEKMYPGRISDFCSEILFWKQLFTNNNFGKIIHYKCGPAWSVFVGNQLNIDIKAVEVCNYASIQEIIGVECIYYTDKIPFQDNTFDTLISNELNPEIERIMKPNFLFKVF